jgi:hypothetical protein
MTTEQMWEQARTKFKTAKALQQQLQTVTDPIERKEITRKMNDLFTQAASLRNEAKNRHAYEGSIEREFLSIKANMEKD